MAILFVAYCRICKILDLLGCALGLAGFPMLVFFVAAALKLFLSARLIEGFAFAIVLTVWGLSVLLKYRFCDCGSVL